LNKPIPTEEVPVYDPEDPLSIEPDEPESSKASATEARDAPEATNEEIVIDDDDDADEDVSRPGPSAPRNETEAFVLPKSANRMLVFLSLGNRYNLINCLENLRPSYVVLYHTDVVSTRLIETFKAHNKSHPLHLYALMQKETIEEERYLLAIQREQTSLELLIREQGVLLVPTEYDVSRDSASHLRSMTLQKDTRDARRDEDEEVPKVIVDMREFNSELPTVLYRRGIDLVAATLEVGDYVLSPQICVERKALDDLAQSLTNGRVFKQTEQ
ncbi:ERCC4 domain containing protein, partial [Aphelenchoides avenae]